MTLKNHSLTVLVLCLLLAGVFCGCRKAEVKKAPPAAPGKSILIGLIPEQNLFRQMDRYEPLAAYLSSKTGLRIRLTVLPRYGNIIDHFLQEGMDGAFFGSFTYALAHAKLGVQVLARPESLDGTSTYHGLIFVRKDSRIVSPSQMVGKRFAFVDRATTAGYLLPLAYFKKHRFDYRSGLRETYYSGTHEDTIYDVLNRKADIGCAKNTVYERIAAGDSRIGKELLVLEHSPDVPENAFAVRKDLDETLKKKLRETLLNMQNDIEGQAILKAFGASKFIPTDEDDYQPVYQYARQIGLDLATYNYRND